MPKPNVRDKILAAGFEVMYRLGFNGCSIQDITDTAGVPKGSFYNHFKSKEVLGIEIINFYWCQTAVSLRILSDLSLSPIQRIKRHFEELAKGLAEQHYERGCLIGNFGTELSDQSEPVRHQVSSVFSVWVRQLESCLRDAQRVGEVRADVEASILASFLVNAWEGTILRSKVERSGDAIEHFKVTVFSFLLPG